MVLEAAEKFEVHAAVLTDSVRRLEALNSFSGVCDIVFKADRLVHVFLVTDSMTLPVK